MSETVSDSLQEAYRLIDSVTRLKGVLGAVLLDSEGAVIAEDYVSPEQEKSCEGIAEHIIPVLAAGSEKMKFGPVNDVMIQTPGATLRFMRKERAWLAVFAGNNVNIGMLNVELRDLRDLLHVIGGGKVVEERDEERELVLENLRATRSVNALLEVHGRDITELRKLHGVLFHLGLDLGLEREKIYRAINDVNYRIYRDSLLDIGFDFFNRKALENYDPELARRVLREQIQEFVKMVLPFV